MATQNLSVDRDFGLDLAVALLAAYGEPQFIKLLDAVVKRVGKENVGPVLLAFKSGIDKTIKKHKIK